jgi:hypothetical protein
MTGFPSQGEHAAWLNMRLRGPTEYDLLAGADKKEYFQKFSNSIFRYFFCFRKKPSCRVAGNGMSTRNHKEVG